MAHFLTTKGITHQLETIIRESKRSLYLISPYLKFSANFQQRLKDAAARGVPIRIAYGKDELEETERNFLAGLERLSLHYRENLHAKCYFNESHMVITSMNLYDYSENNTEMGIFLNRATDRDIYEQAYGEVQSILQASKEVALARKPSLTKITQEAKPARIVAQVLRTLAAGHCIRCDGPVDYNPDKPYCYGCYLTWAEYENEGYKEKYCHCCGGPAKTSMGKPECHACYR